MKALILDGDLAGQTMTAALREHLCDLFFQKGWEVQSTILHEQKIAYCLGCFECWTKSPGLCRIDDHGRVVAAAVIHSDLVVYLTPITFGGFSSALKKAIDRNICLVAPFFTKINGEVHHQPRYAHYPAILGVGLLPQPDERQAAIFAKLIERNAINLHAPTYATVIIDGAHAAATLPNTLEALVQKVQVHG